MQQNILTDCVRIVAAVKEAATGQEEGKKLLF